MNNPIKALLIDDNKEFCIALSGEAREQGIFIVDAQDLEIGMDKLNKDKLIQFVILDGKCFITEDQEIESESFMHEAINQVQMLENKEKRSLPLCVNTGYFKDLESSLLGRNISIFNKEHDKRKLFEFIHEQVKLQPLSLLKLKYPHVFEIFEIDLINSTHQAKLIRLLDGLENEELNLELFNTARKLLEVIFTAMLDKYDHFPLKVFGRKGQVNLTYCCFYLSGKKVKIKRTGEEETPEFTSPKYIQSALLYVLNMTQSQSHHNSEKLTIYSYRSTVNALLEILTWIPDYLKVNYPKKN